MSDLSVYQCRDCGSEYEDHIGDHCPECGGANVVLLGDAGRRFGEHCARNDCDNEVLSRVATRIDGRLYSLPLCLYHKEAIQNDE